MILILLKKSKETQIISNTQFRKWSDLIPSMIYTAVSPVDKFLNNIAEIADRWKS